VFAFVTVQMEWVYINTYETSFEGERESNRAHEWVEGK